MKKQYVGISRDHSGSMGSLRQAAIKDYNNGIDAIKIAAKANDIDTVVSVTSCGIGSLVRREVVNSSVSRLLPIHRYEADGSTPLFDSVGELIDIMKSTPDYNSPDVTFLVMAITDGEENASRVWKHKLGEEIRRLQATDRWTFVFRVPNGYARNLERLGIPSGNIQEWETTERGLRESSVQTVSAVSNYFQGVSRGVRSTNTFYAKAAGNKGGAVGNLDALFNNQADAGSRNWAEVQAGDTGTLNNYLELPTSSTTRKK